MDKVLPRLRKLFGERMMTRHRTHEGKPANIRVGIYSKEGTQFYIYGVGDTWEQATKDAEARVAKAEQPIASEDI